jgi:hypothetical protein
MRAGDKQHRRETERSGERPLIKEEVKAKCTRCGEEKGGKRSERTK